ENKASDLVKMDILLNQESIDALSIIVHKDCSYDRGRRIVEKVKELIPKQQFEVPVQAATGSSIVARSTINAVRIDVTAGLYGGERSRKRKVLKKQKEGKKRMKLVASVEVPQEAFMSVLQLTDD